MQYQRGCLCRARRFCCRRMSMLGVLGRAQRPPFGEVAAITASVNCSIACKLSWSIALGGVNSGLSLAPAHLVACVECGRRPVCHCSFMACAESRPCHLIVCTSLGAALALLRIVSHGRVEQPLHEDPERHGQDRSAVPDRDAWRAPALFSLRFSNDLFAVAAPMCFALGRTQSAPPTRDDDLDDIWGRDCLGLERSGGGRWVACQARARRRVVCRRGQLTLQKRICLSGPFRSHFVSSPFGSRCGEQGARACACDAHPQRSAVSLRLSSRPTQALARRLEKPL